MKTLLLMVLALLGLGACGLQTPAGQPDPDRTYDLLITGGTLADGTGNPPHEADLLAKDGEIVFIGELRDREQYEADRRIEAAGRVVAPGFIDAHAHGDPLQTPEFENFLAMGVTTITLGQDGSSPDRRDLGGWMQEVEDAAPAVNVGVFKGHGTLRDLADVGPVPDPGPEKIDRMAKLVERAMADGAYGVSTGLEYGDARFAGMQELVRVAEPVARSGGLVMSHMRSEDEQEVDEALDELLEQGVRSGSDVHVSHIKIVHGNDPGHAERMLQRMDEVRTSEDISVTADLYPYTASFTGISIVFPEWALPPNDYEQIRRERGDELASYLRDRVQQRNGPEATLFGTGPWAGMTLEEVAEELEKPFEQVLMEDIGPGGARAAYFVMDEQVMQRFFRDPNVMVSSDGSPGMRHPRGYGSFAKVIEEWVAGEELLSIEEAVYKMSGLPARTIGYDRSSQSRPDIDQLPRGFLKEGYAADLLILDPKQVEARADFKDPYRAANGFDYVFVNGEAAIEDGEPAGVSNGQMLRR